jgi:hypothetical protein
VRAPASKACAGRIQAAIIAGIEEPPMDLHLLKNLLGLLIPLAGIAFPIAVIVIVLQYRERQRQQLHDTIKHFADRGMPVPRELLDPPRSARHRVLTPRFGALTLVGVGVGIALMFWSLELPSLIGIGGLVLCVGVAQLVALGLDARDARRAPPSPPEA